MVEKGTAAPLVGLFRNFMSRAVIFHCNTYSRTKWGRQNFQVKCEETMNAYLAEEGKLALLWLSRFSTSIESLNVTHFKKVNWEEGIGKKNHLFQLCLLAEVGKLALMWLSRISTPIEISQFVSADDTRSAFGTNQRNIFKNLQQKS